MTRRRPEFRLVAGAVLAHAAVNLAHGVPHATVPVPLEPWQEVFVGVVVGAAPVVGLWFAWRGRWRLGGIAVLVGGLGSFLFGTYFHFLSDTPDNVAVVSGAGSMPFLLTALGISVLALATAGVGAWMVRRDYPTRV